MRAKWAIGGAAVWSVGLFVAGALWPAYSSATSGTATSSSTTAVSIAPAPQTVGTTLASTAPAARAVGTPPAVTSAPVTAASRTLVQVNGVGALIVLAIPLLLVVAVALLLPRHRRVAWVVTGLAYVFAFLGAFTIGPFVLPVAILLVVACALDYSVP